MPEYARRDGYAPIGCYAALGDGRTVALVAADGRIDWLPMPAIDSPPAFAAVLDAGQGGRLARVVRAEQGAVPMRWRVAPGRRFGAAEPWAQWQEQDDGRVPLIRLGDQSLAVVTARAGQPRLGAHEVSGEFTAAPGDPSLLAVTAADDGPVMVPAAGHIIDRVGATVAGWQAWRRTVGYAGPHADAVARSALTLALLTITATGANAAAATTSLPEAIGGQRNYDYRFTWVRDASFALDALTYLDLLPEVQAMLSWLLRAVRQTAPDVHVFYTLDGQPASAREQDLPLAGYLGTGPVQAGNSAASQRQLGAYGHLMDAAYRYVRHGGLLDSATGTMLAGLADKVCDVWRLPDAGLWELGDYQHYTSSKLGCWVALDRAGWLTDRGQLPGWHRGRWRTAAGEISDWINEHCWSAAKEAYTMHAGTDDLDAAVLLAGRTGFCDGHPERLRSTITAVRRELTAGGPLLYRYTGMRGQEGAFAACSFWLVEALGCTGQHEEAADVFDAMLAYRNDVGLLSEEIDPQTGQLLGNFPQGLSHLALIGAARAVSERRSEGQVTVGERETSAAADGG